MWLFLERFFTEYNIEGRYFDENAGVVYEQQAIMAYGVLAFVLTVISATLLHRLKKKMR